MLHLYNLSGAYKFSLAETGKARGRKWYYGRARATSAVAFAGKKQLVQNSKQLGKIRRG